MIEKRPHGRTQRPPAATREALYAEFIVEASRRFADASGHQPEGYETIVGVYAAVERMRLLSSPRRAFLNVPQR